VIVLDTTVLVYAVGAEHPLRGPCRSLISMIAEGRVAASTSVEVLREFAHVRARRSGRADAAELASDYARLLAPVLVCDADDLEAGLQLFRSHGRLGAFDAVLAAMAIRRGASGLVSADGGFDAIAGLSWLDPAAADFVTRLGPG
jgi:predicted nucleic acid-binding protein